MKSLISTVCFMLLFPCISTAAVLQLEIPQGLSDVYLLSPGTPSMLQHLRSQHEHAIEYIKQQYRIDTLKTLTEKADAIVKRYKQDYAAKLASLRHHYLDSVSLTIVSSEAELSPASSALGEISFIYRITNNSDRIITDISYTPMIAGIKLPTTSALILELIHPLTLKSGLGPGETLTNKGHDPEHFSFFIGELTKEEIKKIQSGIDKDFTIKIQNMHFTDKKGYKGQTTVMDFEQAFPSQLRQGRDAIQKAQTEKQEKVSSLNKAMAEYNEDKEKEFLRYKKSLEDLRKTAVRHQTQLDEKKRCTFENIASGTYYVYAHTQGGQTVFSEITVKDTKTKLVLNDMTKDPFMP